ncbi:MAG: alpha-2-macroglobulin, partial [Alphaproteobacteria bacterium]
GLALPVDVEDKMKSALRSFVGGNLRAHEGTGGDLVPRKLAAIAALATAGGDGGADPALLAGITVEPALWPTRTVLDWWQVLRRSPGVPDRAARLQEALDVLRARLDLSGTTLAFAADPRARFGDGFGGEDVDALRLVLGAVESGAFEGEQGRLMRGALARQQKGAWLGTVANAWGTVATRRFVATHEKEPVGGTTTASLADASQSVDWTAEPRGRVLSFGWPSGGGDLSIDHRGPGRPWATIRTSAAVPLAEPLSAGFRVHRTVEPIERKRPDRWSVGDSMRVRIEVDAAADQGWTVVDDPVPPGATHLARGFATDSSLAGPVGTPAPGTPSTFEERAFEGFRAYYESVGAGRLVAEYSIRLNQAGVFHLPPTHVEALYSPEVMAEAPIPPLEVVE